VNFWDFDDVEELVDSLLEKHDEFDVFFWLGFQADQLEASNSAHPDFRATITREQLWIRPSQELEPNEEPDECVEKPPRGVVVVVDLSVQRSGRRRELIVCTLGSGDLPMFAVNSLVAWAKKTGYSRFWFPDRLVDIDEGPDPDEAAHVQCPSCRTTFHRGGAGFWLAVVEHGYFPDLCEVCGGQLPQWETDAGPT
jgi:hypothetical protein